MYRILVVLALLLILAILGGSIYALATGSPGGRSPKATASPQASGRAAPSVSPSTTSLAAAEAGIFSGLGRLRCPTAGDKPGMVILQAAFPYYPGDLSFSEELASRIRELRNITIAYFAALTPEELGRKGEADVKAELLARYNGILRLGRIETLYFNEYMVIE
ncbi:hypothetical protein AGMMS4952_06420 [Spirochaetia bacterium]|nr:hypothetical protein AGMMS4952_06420 [Spirochaetia bacterium]